MLGFIKKDLLVVKQNIKTYIIIFVFYAIMAFQGNLDISFMLPFLCIVIMMSTFSYDNYNNWDSYAVTLPNGRKNIVRSKYIVTFLLIIVTTILVSIISIGSIYYHHEVVNIDNMLMTIGGTVIGTIVVVSFMYPLIIKFGIEKARIFIFVIVFGLIFIVGLVLKYVDLSFVYNIFNLIDDKYANVIWIILIVLILIGSYKLSERIYLKKEF